jgi:hypothetical protein
MGGEFPRDASAEGVLVGVQDEVSDRDGVVGEALVDLAPVLLDQDGHGDHESAADVVEYAVGGLDDEGPPRRPVLEVVRLGQTGRDVHEHLADLLSVEHPGARDQLLHECAGRCLACPVGAVDPYDHGTRY